MTAEEMYGVISKDFGHFIEMLTFMDEDDFQGGVTYLKELFQCDDDLAERCLMEFKEKEYALIVANRSPEEWKHRQAEVELEVRARANQPKCPTCGSTDLKKISGTAKAAGALAFGLFSKTARSQFQCRNCGYKW